MKVGDLVMKKSTRKNKMMGVVLEIGESCNIIRVFWSSDYGTFWTLAQSLRKVG